MTDISAYQAATKSAVYFHQPQAGLLRVAGRDRVDFLQRQSTNDLRLLTADRAVSTVLTSPTARVLDLFCVIDEDDWLAVVTLDGRFAETYKFLRGRIFFSDQVSIEDLSGDIAQFLLLGPLADGVLQKLGLQTPKPDHINRTEVAGHPTTIIGQKVLADIGYRFLAPAAAVDTLLERLNEAGAIPLDFETFESLRVEAGQPGPAGELVEAFTPLEIGLQEMISASKGCYTGQEIIARQITYDKVSKNLVGVRLDELVRADAEIKVDRKSAGRLTSVVQSPRFGPIGLAVMRRQYSEVGMGISIVRGDGSLINGEIAELPFL